MTASRLDAVYRSILITKFFTKGWGKPDNLKRLFEFRKVISNRDQCYNLISRDYPVTITKEETWSDCRVMEGHFQSPLHIHLPGIVPESSQKAHFQVILPLNWRSAGFKPMCLHLAGTGDHHFWRRRNLMAKPLLKEGGIGAIILENPFYGARKPKDQVRSCLQNVSDIFVMGGCLILESLVLFHWCERNGLGPLGVTGLSMGGHMASLAATNWPKPMVLVPCLSWSTASPVFTQGVMSQSINWELLETQYFSDGVYREKLSKMVTIVDQAFLAGKTFAQTLTNPTQHNNANTTVTERQAMKDVDQIAKNLIRYNKIQEVIRTVENGNGVVGKAKLLQSLKSSNKISESLYDKIMSDKKFDLNAAEINELNNLNIDELETSFGVIPYSRPMTELPILDGEFKKPFVLLAEEVDALFRASVLNELKTRKLSEPEKVTQLVKTEEKNKVMNVESSRSFADITMEILGRVPLLLSKSKTTKVKVEPKSKVQPMKIHWRDREALQFMRGVMDECTHLSNFTIPYDTSLIIAVCAKNDAYVPQEGSSSLEEVWPGAEVRYLDAGHVSAYVLHQKLFRSSIIEAFDRSKQKWKDGQHVDK